MMADMVNHPAHYAGDGIEAIEVMRAFSSHDEYVGHLRNTALKYLLRYRRKGHVLEDLRKARWYLDRLIEAWERVEVED